SRVRRRRRPARKPIHGGPRALIRHDTHGHHALSIQGYRRGPTLELAPKFAATSSSETPAGQIGADPRRIVSRAPGRVGSVQHPDSEESICEEEASADTPPGRQPPPWAGEPPSEPGCTNREPDQSSRPCRVRPSRHHPS